MQNKLFMLPTTNLTFINPEKLVNYVDRSQPEPRRKL